MLNPSALVKYLERFFGYGRWDAPIWFIGIEEAGGHIESELEKRLAVWEAHERVVSNLPKLVPLVANGICRSP
jgi:hypothetical protein